MYTTPSKTCTDQTPGPPASAQEGRESKSMRPGNDLARRVRSGWATAVFAAAGITASPVMSATEPSSGPAQLETVTVYARRLTPVDHVAATVTVIDDARIAATLTPRTCAISFATSPACRCATTRFASVSTRSRSAVSAATGLRWKSTESPRVAGSRWAVMPTADARSSTRHGGPRRVAARIGVVAVRQRCDRRHRRIFDVISRRPARDPAQVRPCVPRLAMRGPMPRGTGCSWLQAMPAQRVAGLQATPTGMAASSQRRRTWNPTGATTRATRSCSSTSRRRSPGLPCT
jgi:hypothetical protein